jgi:hypothetical protein
MLKTFQGYKGKMAAAKIGEVPFVLMARTAEELAVIWERVMPGVPLDPAGVRAGIVVEANTLPENPRPQPLTAEPTSQADRLKKLRLAKGVTWRELGELLGFSRSMLFYVRTGQRQLSDLALERLKAAECGTATVPSTLPERRPATAVPSNPSEPSGTATEV